MRKLRFILPVITLIISLAACNQPQISALENTKVAFMADVHLQNIYGKFEDSEFQGAINPDNNKHVIARTMQDQLNSTRIFNENYFAFLAALDDVANRGTKYVVLPGDFSDDGQPLNVRGLKNILDRYSEKYGIRFLLTTGNHDPVRPYSMDTEIKYFLKDNGQRQAITSKKDLNLPVNANKHSVVVTQDMRKMGYKGIVQTMGDFGFLPKKEDVYWETPFTNYSYDDYSYKVAKEQSDLKHRTYSNPPYYTPIPDASYLVEPEFGLWFLAIDANVYVPTEDVKNNPSDPSNYIFRGGYNNVLTYKKHLIEWVKKITEAADKHGKTLIVFSHYPMVDFNDDASSYIKDLLGDNKMQLHRIPKENVARIFANAGIKLHFAGHMHINDTGIRKSEKGNCLINIQVPTLAGYMPAYKLLTVKNNNIMEVETIVLDSVPRFNELFPLYEKEHAYLSSIKSKNIWNKDILLASSYHDFASWHLRELVRLRFLKNDWPEDFKKFLLHSSGKDLLLYSKAEFNELKVDWKAYESWTGFDMIYDLYRLRSADKLAIDDIGEDRIKQYQLINGTVLNNSDSEDPIFADFQNFAGIFNHFLNGAPANHFQVNLSDGEILDLSKECFLPHSINKNELRIDTLFYMDD